MIVAARGDIVTREELRDRIWGRNTYVEFDRAINKAINHLRQVLGDDAGQPRFIETLRNAVTASSRLSLHGPRDERSEKKHENRISRLGIFGTSARLMISSEASSTSVGP